MKRKRMLNLVVVVTLLLVAPFATGCSEQAKKQDVAAHTNKTSELKQNVTGIWRVEKSDGTDISSTLEDAGLSAFYIFDEDGTFTMRLLASGEKLDRIGTWKITKDHVVINVPEMEERTDDSNSLIVKLSGKEIKDAEVAMEDGTLEVELNDHKIQANKTTQKQYDDIIEKTKAMGPQKITLNQQVNNNGCTFTIASMDFVEEIYPDDTSGFYQYYEDETDSSYLVARVNVTNTHNEYISLGCSTKAQFELDGNKYSAQIDIIDGANMSQSYSIDPQQTASLYIFSSIPNSMRNAQDVKLSWMLPKSGSLLNKYYSASMDANTYVLVK